MLITLANGLSLLRLAGALPCAWAVTTGDWILGAACFAFAVASDLADGPLARRRGTASALGGLIDHSSDAVFVTCVLAAFALRDAIPPLLPVLIPLAFLQYVLDSRAERGAPLRASFLGRWNGIAYFVLAGMLIGERLVPAPGGSTILAAATQGAAWLLVASTLASMLDRALALRRLSTAGDAASALKRRTAGPSTKKPPASRG